MARDRNCIVCGGRTAKLFDWDKGAIARAYSTTFAVAFPESIGVPDYEMRRCEHCMLEFANPMRPGDAEFYGWIASQESYYPNTRWEWAEVKAQLAEVGTGIKVLEVGCGVCHFLEFLSDVEGISLIGLDTNTASVEECRRRGITALQSDIADFHAEETFDAICAFHCLEHVPNPVSFLRRAADLLSPDGRIFASVPYSPTSLAITGEDCLNLPPHHLTRWTARSLYELARTAGLSLSLRVPARTGGRLRAALHALSAHHRELKSTPTPLIPLRLLANPGALKTAIRALRFYASRDLVDGTLAGDTVLATFAGTKAASTSP